jgi:hypothetical protein
MLDLTSVRAKLARAQEHAQTIKNEIVSWHDRNPYSVLQKIESDGSRYSLIMRVNEAAPVQRWTLITADALNNMRSALDSFVFAIASYESAPNPPNHESRLAFPITDNRSSFDEAIAGHRLGDISEPIRAVIESFQPYNRRHEHLPPLLGMLRDLNNADKHRLLRLVYGAVHEGNVGLIGGNPLYPPVVCGIAHDGEIEDGTEVLAFICDPPTPNLKFDQTVIGVVVAIWHGKRDPSGPAGSDRNEVVSILSLLHKEVRNIIYDVSAAIR